MTTIENQCPDNVNRVARRKYGLPMITRTGSGHEELCLQLQLNHMETWKTQDALEDDSTDEEADSDGDTELKSHDHTVGTKTSLSAQFLTRTQAAVGESEVNDSVCVPSSISNADS
ncbi:hypothetical protein PINS_up007717 [Pythium insidiosum]|nr:hypothetical protein PINS_up007717 [Pythium insidiosum]